MKKILFAFICLMLIQVVHAQNSTSLKGKVTDTLSKQNLKDASISMLNAKDSTVESFGLAKTDGTFEIKGFAMGSYLLQISFNGYESYFKSVVFNKQNPTLDLGTIILKPQAKELEGVSVVAAPIQVKGDTTEFNAGSFKTKPNATAEDLLKKLPGVQVEKDGSVKAQGQTVKRVLVDGKRFFGDDPTTATRNLPTDVIDKVQVYDAQSDQSSFSGFDDGNRDKTINIITKKDRRKGYFGKLSIGAGNNERYATNANFNRFNGNQQISFIGQGNNINQQNFSMQDLFGTMNSAGGRGGGGMFGGGMRGGNLGNFLTTNQAGIATTWAAGLNYNDVWSKKTSVSGSYFYNNMKRNNDNESHTETFVTNDSSQFNNNNTFSNYLNQNHRFNFEFDHKFDSVNSLLVRPNFSYQISDNNQQTISTLTKGKLVNLSNVQQVTNSQNTGYNFSTSILLRHKFKKRGRTISLNLTPGLSNNESDGSNISYNDIYTINGIVKDTINQINSNDRNGRTFSSNLSYTEPITKKSQLELSYNYNYSKNNSNQQTLMYNKQTNSFDIIVPNLTNKFENTNTSNKFNANYRVQLTKEWSYTLGMGVQFAELTSINNTKATKLSNTFTNYFPSVQLHYSKNRTKNLRLVYRGQTNAPSITQLQDVIDNSNQLNIRNGNAGLEQEFQHNFNLFYTNFDVITFKNFFVSINGSFTQNKIGNSVIQNTGTTPTVVDGIVLIPGAQYTKPINLNGAMNIFGFINYGFPIKKPKSNLNFSTTMSYIKDVNLYNQTKNYTHNYIIGERVNYNMNVKEVFDVNFASSSSYTFARYTLNNEQNGDYFTQTFSIEPTYSSKSGWIIGSDFDLTINRGQSVGYNQTIPLWNASIAKTIFKNKSGEIKFSVFDLLNQNKSINRTVEQNYIQDTRTQVLTRYFMLSFTYNLRKFAGKGQQMPPFMRGMMRNAQPRMMRMH
ncbi:MAG TPA: outer membrane beta-barrel protein [Chitinophagaceae bacterium]|nr:outer membrane beta-barrel protein [Chitinophagaceae bacterium]HNE92826.1 outer membrane beta-barrel protein [Chitinophagaceae bacterium]HNF28726.1 outer membrane beta-barrel protein [Chitinophagaceae bacterium]HNJ57786.1 outer membrane beta-barrel protein [Chitinophagaceae bacterium]HNM33280.1 outer membrane beta-barrel protein [Chitinophagaceae bacterium]